LRGSRLFSGPLKSCVEPIGVRRRSKQVCSFENTGKFVSCYHGDILTAAPLNDYNLPVFYSFINQ